MKKIFTLCCLLAFAFSYAQTGNIGIGTANPKAQLHTTGSVKFDTLKSGGAGLLYVTDSGTLYTRSLTSINNINETTVSIPDNNCSGVNSSITIANIRAVI